MQSWLFRCSTYKLLTSIDFSECVTYLHWCTELLNTTIPEAFQQPSLGILLDLSQKILFSSAGHHSHARIFFTIIPQMRVWWISKHFFRILHSITFSSSRETNFTEKFCKDQRNTWMQASKCVHRKKRQFHWRIQGAGVAGKNWQNRLGPSLGNPGYATEFARVFFFFYTKACFTRNIFFPLFSSPF